MYQRETNMRRSCDQLNDIDGDAATFGMWTYQHEITMCHVRDFTELTGPSLQNPKRLRSTTYLCRLCVLLGRFDDETAVFIDL
jgi:hypothetical protein